MKHKNGFGTKAIHAGEEPVFSEGANGDVIIPIHLSTTFARIEPENPTAGYEYSRSLNPTRNALEKKYAAIENAKYGLAFSSGLAAQTTLLLSILRNGDHVIAGKDLYGGSKRIFNHVLVNFDIKTSYADTTNVANIKKAIKPNTKLIWLESPTNPLLIVSDIKAIADLAHKHEILFVVDNTFMTAYFQNPLDLGADISLHSATKYMGGHSDVVSGALMLNDDTLYEKIKYYQNAIGAIASPFDSYLVLRGLKTLGVRMEKHQHNALEIAKFLESHKNVKKVIYPGLKDHPQYTLSKKQTKGLGGMLSFELKGNLASAKKFLKNLKLIALAESLGGVESLIELPAIMTHSSVPKKDRQELGITDTLIRLSVGIEDTNDLINDIKQALEK